MQSDEFQDLKSENLIINERLHLRDFYGNWAGCAYATKRVEQKTDSSVLPN